jgi:hypothetical protein
MPELRASLQTDPRISHGFTEAKLSSTALTVVEEHGDRLRAAYVHALRGSRLRLSVLGRCAPRRLKMARSLMTGRNASVAATVWWRVRSACPGTSGRSWFPMSRNAICALRARRKANCPHAWRLARCRLRSPADREEILDEAQRRIFNDSKYVKHIYGSDEAGGTSVFFISDVPFEKLGFVAAPKQSMPVLTATALGDGPTVILVGGALLSGLYWITQRRALVALAEAREKSLKERELSHDFHWNRPTWARRLAARPPSAKTGIAISANQLLAHGRGPDFRRRHLLDVCAVCAGLPVGDEPDRSLSHGDCG